MLNTIDSFEAEMVRYRAEVIADATRPEVTFTGDDPTKFAAAAEYVFDKLWAMKVAGTGSAVSDGQAAVEDLDLIDMSVLAREAVMERHEAEDEISLAVPVLNVTKFVVKMLNDS